MRRPFRFCPKLPSSSSSSSSSVFVLIVAVISASTAGAIFKILEREPLYANRKEDEEKVAVLLASSRLTATALVQLPIFSWCYFRGGGGGRRGDEGMDENDARYLRENARMFILSGFFLCLHFFFWMNGLVRTSLSHSLLFVTSSPIAYVCLTAMTFRSKTVQKIIVWVVTTKKNAGMNDVRGEYLGGGCGGDGGDGGDGGGGDGDDSNNNETPRHDIELHEYNAEEGKGKEIEEDSEEEQDGNDDDDDDDDEFTELYTVPRGSSSSPPSSSSSSILRFKDVSKFEVIGSIIGFIGSCIIAFDATNSNSSSIDSGKTTSESTGNVLHRSDDDRPSLKGDILSLLSAILVCGYIAIGAKIRGDRPSMPIFVYSFPIVASAAIFLQILVVLLYAFNDHAAAAAATDDDDDDDNNGGFSPAVFFESYRWMKFWDAAVGRKTFFLVLFLAIVPGTLGHSGFFVAMKHLSSLTVTFALSFEPIIGSAIGYLLSVSAIPGPTTFVGGFVLLVGVYCCNL